jgi:D-alanine-D-alanine ligase
MAKIKLALLSGGLSKEREVSLKTGEKIFEALDKKKYDIFRYDPKSDLEKLIKDLFARKIDLVFPALHGPYGEDGTLQGMLDMFQVPYVFSGTLASSLAMNKFKTKRVAECFGVRVAKDLVISKGSAYELDRAVTYLGLPIVVKPTELGSSVGITIAKTEKELKYGVEKAIEHGEVLLEEFIEGRELTVAVMGSGRDPEALPVIEIKPKKSDWFDYKAKYEAGASEEICPAPISDEIKRKIQKDAVTVFQAIGCRDLARADFICDEDNKKLYFLEINTIPGMTATSLAPQAAKEYGLDFPKFLDKLIELALERKNNHR